MPNHTNDHRALGLVHNAPGSHIDDMGAKAGIYVMLAIAAAEAVAGIATYLLA